MAQQPPTLFQVDYFEVYGARARRHSQLSQLSLEEAEKVIQHLLKGLAEGKIDSFTVTPYEEWPGSLKEEEPGDAALPLPNEGEEIFDLSANVAKARGRKNSSLNRGMII